jgi:hypothetical protein
MPVVTNIRMFDVAIGNFNDRSKWHEVEVPKEWKKKYLSKINSKMTEEQKSIENSNLQAILDRIKQVQGIQCRKEVRNIIGRFPDASNFEITEFFNDGFVKEYPGTKIKNYILSKKHICILILQSETGKGKKKKVHNRYLKFNHNQKPEK